MVGVEVRALVYTANIGGHDRAWSATEQVGGIEVDWLYVTDQPSLIVPPPWQRSLVRQEAEHPNMRAKRFRTHPPFTLSEPAYDYCIWIDASMQVRSARFVREAIAACGDAPVALWKHPRRDCVYQEIGASLDGESQDDRYRRVPLVEQGIAYRDEDYPAHNGLYATGTIVWRNCDEARALGSAWYEECQRWGYQDQVSFPVVAWRLGVTPAVFPHTQTRLFNRRLRHFANAWMLIHEHVPGTSFAERDWRSSRA